MSKKYLILILSAACLFMWGCTKKINNNFYDVYVNKLESISSSSEDLPFDVNITIEKLTNTLSMYQVIIDNSKYLLYNVKAIVIHDIEVSDIFPSIGIVDSPINLNNTSNDNTSKGIILTGYLPYQNDYNINFKVLIEYVFNNQTFTKYYVLNMTQSNNN